MIGKEILNYTIVSLIGKGGMGSVYLAEHKYIKQQKVAIKVINGNMINDFTRQRLAEEADRLARMNHPNIVHFINYHIDEAGCIYLIMEYADGYSLEDYIKNVSGLIVEEKICSFFEPLLDAFEYAHKHKIIHKDIKPSNIIITNEGTPKILDFGIAALLDEGGESNDKDVIMGTPSYMSPEQVKGESLDQRSDIYSLGVLLHQMLTGNPPYDTTTLTEHEIYKNIVEEDLPRMKTYYKYVSDKVQTVVDKATNKKVESRYQSCLDFRKALHNAIYPPKVSKAVKALLVAVAAIIIAGGIFVWDYNRVKVSYYKDYVEQWGVPQGIGELSESDVEHREASYRFEYSKRKLRRVTLVNSYGNITDHHDSEHVERPSDMQLFYSDNGNVSYVKILDKNGKVLYKKSYNDKLNTVIFQYDDTNDTEFVLAATTLKLFQNPFSNTENRGRITRYLLTYDERGYVEKQEYASFFNTKVGDADGIYARMYIRDEKGRVLEERYLGYDGTPKGNKSGLGIRRHKYNENDDWIETAYRTVDDQESTDGNGVSVVRLELDEYGNRIKESYFDSNGAPVLRTDYNVAGIIYTRNEKGLCLEMSYFDIDGTPCYSRDGIAGIKQEYDANGYLSKIICFDEDKQTCHGSEGWAYRTCVNDSIGNLVETWMYNVDGKLVETPDGFAGVKMKYDKLGNQIEYLVYGTDGKLTLLSDNTAGYLAEYNEQNFIVKLTKVNDSMQPCKDDNGVAILIREYDNRGNVIKIAYLDAENNPVLNNENIAGINYLYDEYGNILELSYFGLEGEPCMLADGLHKIVYKYDENGHQSNERYYGLKNELILKNNVAGYDYLMDERGNLLSLTPIGLDGKLRPGHLILKRKYDKNDQEIECAWYDIKGPAINEDNYHRYTCKYNNRNQMTEIVYYGKNEELVCYKNDKYAIQQQEYDAKGNCSRCIFLGTNHQPVVCNEGWHVSTYEYDAQGRVIRQLFFGLDGMPTDPGVMVPEGVCKYDKWGNQIYIASCDGHGNLIMNHQAGWSVRRCEYDNKGNMLSDSYFNEKDSPMLCEDGFHKGVYTYSNSNMIHTRSYFDTRGLPMLCKAGYHKIVNTYTNSNNIESVSFFDVAEKPMLIYGYHKEVYKYDENDLCIEQACFGKTGKPIDCSAGFHKIVVTYNKDLSPRDRKFYTVSGKMFLHQQYINDNWENVTNWRKNVSDFADELPLNLGDDAGNLVIQTAKVVGSSRVEIIMVAPKSKYDMTDSMLDAYKQYVTVYTEYCKQFLEIPRNVTVKGILKDSKGRDL